MKILQEILSLTGSIQEGADRVEFFAEVWPIPGELRGHEFLIEFGPVTIMAIKISEIEQQSPARYGPTYLQLKQVRDLHDFTLSVRAKKEKEKFFLRRLNGEFFEAVSLSTNDEFFSKVQINHSRYKSSSTLYIAARSAYLRIDSFTVRAAALTIMGHRLLEGNLRVINDESAKTLDWLVKEAVSVTEEGRGLLQDSPHPSWEIVRWTVSLSTVAAHLSLCRDDLVLARTFYGQALDQIYHVTLSRVSALNLVNACLMYGVLSFLSGDHVAAKQALEKGVTSFPAFASAQNMMENVWVIGDLIDCARSARQCFIALVRFGLIPTGQRPLLDDKSLFDLRSTKSIVPNILAANLAPSLSQGLAAVGRGAPL